MAATTTPVPTPSAAPGASELAQQILEHKAPSYTFSFSPFLRGTYGHGFPPNRPVCKAFVAGHCPQGASCADRHVAQHAASNTNASYNSLVCKHWLRALCKKGEHCEFLHEYNLRKMPECNFFVRNGYCSNGDECLYLHIDPQSKLPPCPHYDRGFCPLGPGCSKKHVRRKLCPYYLAGFCPEGKGCKEGAHPRWEKNLEKPIPKSEVVHEEPVRRDWDMDDDQRDYGRRDRDEKGGGRGDRNAEISADEMVEAERQKLMEEPALDQPLEFWGLVMDVAVFGHVVFTRWVWPCLNAEPDY